jgi:hypothetical protein
VLSLQFAEIFEVNFNCSQLLNGKFSDFENLGDNTMFY